MSKVVDMIGMVCGRLTVIADSGSNKRGKKMWECLCECGNKTVVTGDRLRRGVTKSCGCLHDELLLESLKRYNQFIIKKDYCEGYTTKGETFIFDIDKLNIVSKYCWYMHQGYVVNRVDNITIYLHRLIMNPPNDMYVDHINGNPSDNRVSNLRVCTKHQNNINVTKRAGTSSVYKGVIYKHDRGKWQSRITFGGKTIYLGCYLSEEEAALAYNEKAKELFGEFAKLNEIMED